MGVIHVTNTNILLGDRPIDALPEEELDNLEQLVPYLDDLSSDDPTPTAPIETICAPCTGLSPECFGIDIVESEKSNNRQIKYQFNSNADRKTVIAHLEKKGYTFNTWQTTDENGIFTLHLDGPQSRFIVSDQYAENNYHHFFQNNDQETIVKHNLILQTCSKEVLPKLEATKPPTINAKEIIERATLIWPNNDTVWVTIKDSKEHSDLVNALNEKSITYTPVGAPENQRIQMTAIALSSLDVTKTYEAPTGKTLFDLDLVQQQLKSNVRPKRMSIVKSPKTKAEGQDVFQVQFTFDTEKEREGFITQCQSIHLAHPENWQLSHTGPQDHQLTLTGNQTYNLARKSNPSITDHSLDTMLKTIYENQSKTSYSDWLKDTYGIVGFQEYITENHTKKGTALVFNSGDKMKTLCQMFDTQKTLLNCNLVGENLIWGIPLTPTLANQLESNFKQTKKSTHTDRTIKELQLTELKYAQECLEKVTQIEGTNRLEKLADLMKDKNPGWYFDQAASGFALGIDIFKAIQFDTLNQEERNRLEKASQTMIGRGGDVTKGLKQDANFVNYLSQIHYGHIRFQRGVTSTKTDLNQLIEEDASQLLNGCNDRATITIGTKKLTELTGGTKKVPGFFGKPPETDEIMLQTGGRSNHSTVTKIIRRKDASGKDCYYHVEYNAGAGLTWKGHMTAYTTNVRKIKGETEAEIKANIKQLIIAERHLLLHRPNEDGPTGEHGGTDEDAIEWQTYKDLRDRHLGETDTTLSKAGLPQVSGNCTVNSLWLAIFPEETPEKYLFKNFFERFNATEIKVMLTKKIKELKELSEQPQ